MDYKKIVKRIMRDPIAHLNFMLADKLGFMDYKGKMSLSSLESKLKHVNSRLFREEIYMMLASELYEMDDKMDIDMPENAIEELRHYLASTELNNAHLKALLPFALRRARNEITALDYAELHHYGLYMKELMQSFNPQFAAKLLELIKDKFKGTKINLLDFGTGDGSLLIEMAKQAPNMSCTGFDINEIQLKSAKESKKKENVPNVQFASKLPSGKYKVILMMQVLHDTQEPKETLEYLKTLLDKDGIIILVDPMVSRNMEMNKGEQHAITGLSHSCIHCVLTNNCTHPPGVSFGIEGKMEALLEASLGVLSHGTLTSNKMFYYVVVEKFKSVEEIVKNTFFIDCGLYTLALDLKTLKIDKLKKY